MKLINAENSLEYELMSQQPFVKVRYARISMYITLNSRPQVNVGRKLEGLKDKIEYEISLSCSDINIMDNNSPISSSNNSHNVLDKNSTVGSSALGNLMKYALR